MTFLEGGFADLSLAQRGGDVRISFRDGGLTVEDAEVGDFAANDFLFA